MHFKFLHFNNNKFSIINSILDFFARNSSIKSSNRNLEKLPFFPTQKISFQSFPYMPMVRMLRPPEGSLHPQPVYPFLPSSSSEMEIADIIDSLDVANRNRRSAPVFKRTIFLFPSFFRPVPQPGNFRLRVPFQVLPHF